MVSLLAHFLAMFGRLYSMSLHSNILDKAQATTGALVYAIAFMVRFDVPVDSVAAQLINLMFASSNANNGRIFVVKD